MIHLIDIQLLTRALKSITTLTALNFSLYDDRENLLIAPLAEDPLAAFLQTNKKGQVLYREFLNKYLKLALSLKTTKSFITQGPSAEYHIFIPVRYKDVITVAVSEGFYLSEGDFGSFYSKKGPDLGVTERPLHDWTSKLKFFRPGIVEGYIESIEPLLESIRASGYEKGELNKRWQWSRTIISLAANIKSSSSMQDIRQTVVDTIIFLFNVDTAAVFALRNGYFYPESAGGRNRDIISRLRLSEANPLVSRMEKSGAVITALDSYQLWHSGFPEEIISMYVFPIHSDAGSFGFIGIFNSLLDKESFDSIHELCKLVAYLCGVKHMNEEYEKKSGGLSIISAKTSGLYLHYKEPQMLYDSIVNEAAGLVSAEKCSLMLPADEGEYLNVAAVKGVSKWLMKGVKVPIGEGISGKVYLQGVPLLIDSEEKLKTFSGNPKPLFKTPSCLSVPLRVADETMGILNVSDKTTGEAFSEADLSMLAPFALQASILLKLSLCYRTAEQMRELSITDPLTGLFNRRYFDVRIEEEHQRARRYGLHFSLAIADIDDFKALNDSEGHLAGDQALKEIASVMNNSIRANDILVRFGGEEFAIIMPQTTKEEAFNVMDRIRNTISITVLTGAKSFPGNRLTISTGIAMFPECGDNIESLILQADKALYAAKTQGKNKTVAWDPAINSAKPHSGIRARKAIMPFDRDEADLNRLIFQDDTVRLDGPDEPFNGITL